MEINLFVIIIVIACAIALVIFLIRQNKKDQKDLENKWNSDFKKQEEQEINNEDEY